MADYDHFGSMDSTTEITLRAIDGGNDDDTDLVLRYYAYRAAEDGKNFSLQLGRNPKAPPSAWLNMDAARAIHRFFGYVLDLADRS